MPHHPPRIILIRNADNVDFGGAERFVLSLADQLTKNGWRATVVTRHRRILAEALLVEIPTVRGWWWQRRGWGRKHQILFPLYVGWQLLLTLWYLQLFIRLRPDVVHAQGRDDFIAGTLAARLLGKRVVWTDHADLKYIYQNMRVWYKNPFGRLVYWCSRGAHAITLVSESESRLIQEALGVKSLPGRYRVVYNGIVDTQVVPRLDDKQHPAALVFCATSRLVTAKGIAELITAFCSLPSTPAVRLWLVGDGPEEQRFKDLAAGDERISFFGFSSEPLSFVAAADVFVHPSYHEGFALSIVEAAMLSRPIIACNVGGNPEIVVDHQTGLLIPARDSAALTQAMRQLATNPKLRTQLGTQARAAYEAHFQFDTIVKDQFIPLYENHQD